MKRLMVLKVILFVSVIAFGQDVNVGKIQSKADKLFQVKNYTEALPLYLELEKSGVNDPMLHYKIAKSYSASRDINQRIIALEYFEKIDVSKLEELPYHYYIDFGNAYVENEQLEQALVIFNKQLALVSREKYAKAEIEQKIAQIKNAYDIMRIPKNVNIQRLGDRINSETTEYNPVVSADESVMAYTALRPAEGKVLGNFVEEIYISENQTGSWSIPERLKIETQNNYGTAGISADGQEMLVFIGDRTSGSLYTITKEGETWSRPSPLSGNIQSKYLESTASMTPDNKTIYFASNRPGGYGGMDIYMSERKSDGTWGSAVNLGSKINTKANEDAPFIHPNKTLLFFTTDGHQGMGGNDIYKSEWINGAWDEPRNMGYPINTTANDNYFTLIADGSRGYFSSDRKGGLGGQDIYVMDMPEDYETIPLTLIKGRILDAETKQPLKTKIYMIDTETKEKIDYVYHPNQRTGDYLVILPPNKSYDMIIESDGFLPYTLNIDVPNQKEFYQLYQKIYLKTIKHFDVIVGQEVQVKNAFYDTQAEGVQGMRQEYEAALIEYDSIDVYELMSTLIEAEDQTAIDYLLGLMMLKNPIDEIDFEENNENVQSARRIYYYDESDESKFEKKQVDGEVIYSLPTMFVTKEANAQSQTVKGTSKEYDKQLLDQVLKIYFNAGKSELDKQYEGNLNSILDILNANPDLGVEISGYASSEGDDEYNKKLSNQRAISVLDYINHRGIVRRRIVSKGYGSAENAGVSKEESRRVEVRIVDLNDIK
ncbi:MAG: OmpA family protein [Cyclobacteriaceae bacterium]|nr:OmpA family protein [Cyclobacteriaceae bacterium]